METLTHDQFQDLKKEFVDFKINEMTHEDMYAWIRDVHLHELNKCTIDEIKDEKIVNLSNSQKKTFVFLLFSTLLPD